MNESSHAPDSQGVGTPRGWELTWVPRVWEFPGGGLGTPRGWELEQTTKAKQHLKLGSQGLGTYQLFLFSFV